MLARKTHNPMLAEIVRRLAKNERRHFSFYYNKAAGNCGHAMRNA